MKIFFVTTSIDKIAKELKYLINSQTFVLGNVNKRDGFYCGIKGAGESLEQSLLSLYRKISFGVEMIFAYG